MGRVTSFVATRFKCGIISRWLRHLFLPLLFSSPRFIRFGARSTDRPDGRGQLRQKWMKGFARSKGREICYRLTIPFAQCTQTICPHKLLSTLFCPQIKNGRAAPIFSFFLLTFSLSGPEAENPLSQPMRPAPCYTHAGNKTVYCRNTLCTGGVASQFEI